MLKTLTLTTIAATMLATPALAGGYAYVNHEDHYRTVTVKEPYTVEVCQDYAVDTGSGDPVGGAIIGGLIGSVIGNGLSGQDGAGTAGAVIGAIIGADMEADKEGSTTIETRCHKETRYQDVVTERYDYSTITFKRDGKTYTVRYQK